jgi:hypothetical protein
MKVPTNTTPGKTVASSLLRTLLLSIVSLALALCAAEVALRNAAPQPALLFDRGLYMADEHTGYRHRPGYRGSFTNLLEYSHRVDINQAGLRGGPLVEDTQRILVLGDSFVFGQGVEVDDTFASRLEAKLIEHGRRVRVLNAGVRGYGTTNEAAWLQHYGQALRPRVIVVGVYLGNDLQDNLTALHERLALFEPRSSLHTPLTRQLYAHSHLYRALREAWSMASGSARTQRSAWLSANFGSMDDAAPQVRATARALDSLVQTSGLLGARLLVVLIPDAAQVEPARRLEFERMRTAEPTLGLDILRPNQVLATLLTQRGVQFVDLTLAFQERAANALYLPIDRHWTAAGHRLAAELIEAPVDALAH